MSGFIFFLLVSAATPVFPIIYVDHFFGTPFVTEHDPAFTTPASFPADAYLADDDV
jgi:hypothetical protein